MKKASKKNVLEYNRAPELYFRVGLRHAGRQMYKNALRFLNEAASKEPYNADYQFNLACVLSELGETESSSEIFLSIVRNIDPTFSECYFGVACNFFDMGDYKKARDYFEKYILMDCDGELVDEAYDILQYLKLYGDPGEAEAKKGRTLERITSQAWKLLEAGEPGKAVKKLEKAIEENPAAVLQRIMLSVALHLAGEHERAGLLAGSALKLDGEKLLTHFVLGLIYASCKNDELYSKKMKEIRKLPPEHEAVFAADRELFLKLTGLDGNLPEEARTALLEAMDAKAPTEGPSECGSEGGGAVIPLSKKRLTSPPKQRSKKAKTAKKKEK